MSRIRKILDERAAASLRRQSPVPAIQNDPANHPSSILVAGEDPAQFARLREDLIAQYLPASPMESYWVEEIAASMWRLGRARKYEAKALQNADLIFEDPSSPEARAFDSLTRYMNTIERTRNRALKELQQLQKERAKTEATTKPGAVCAVGQAPEPNVGRTPSPARHPLVALSAAPASKTIQKIPPGGPCPDQIGLV